MRNRLGALTVALACVAAALAGCGTSTPGESSDASLRLVAFSTPREAYAKLVPMFQRTAAGRNVDVTQSYGSSGEQMRAVKAGLHADVVALALAPDVDELVAAGNVDAAWTKQPHGGMITRSVVVFVVREGNPKGISSWDDLRRPGIEIVTPNPFTSGGARWNVMAAYGSWRERGMTHEQARSNLLELWRNVVVQDASARASLSTFNARKGDVLLAYENEALFARKQGLELELVVPAETILVENPVAVTKETRNAAAANAFLEFLRTPAAQQVFVEDGYRPVLESVARRNRATFATPPGLFTIDELGGWAKVQKRFFDPETGLLAEIQRQVGG